MVKRSQVILGSDNEVLVWSTSSGKTKYCIRKLYNNIETWSAFE